MHRLATVHVRDNQPTNDQRRHDTAYLNKRLFYWRKVRRLKTLTVSILFVLKSFMKNWFTTKSSEAICDSLTAQASRPYKSTGTHLLNAWIQPWGKDTTSFNYIFKIRARNQKNATVIKKTISISKNTLSVTYPTDDTGVECVLIQRHIHPRGEVAHRPVEMCRPGEVHQCTCKLAVRYDYDVQSSMLAIYTIL